MILFSLSFKSGCVGSSRHTLFYAQDVRYFARGRTPLVTSLKRKREQRTKVQEHFERANARPEGWSTGCAE